MIPQFEYAPIRITYKRKVQLEDLTKPKSGPGGEIVLILTVCFVAAIVAVVLLILGGALKLFGVKAL